MIDTPALVDALQRLDLDHWQEPLAALVADRLSDHGHGDFSRWRRVVESLSELEGTTLREALLNLSPWRKGPFDIGTTQIDAEWRSDWKWQRIQDCIAPLNGRNVLDVGCGNGYYALRMADAGARIVLGIDPMVLYVMQFLAVNQFETNSRVFVLPARLEELPLPARRFDTTFSMGVLYHRRSPLEHLRQLRDTLRPGGQLVLETLYVPGKESYACTPPDRYARMRNVWLLPTIAELTTWLHRSGFRDIDIIDTTTTTTDEQRTTEWMPFESLAEALDPDDPTRTVEGWPAPRRVALTATPK